MEGRGYLFFIDIEPYMYDRVVIEEKTKTIADILETDGSKKSKKDNNPDAASPSPAPPTIDLITYSKCFIITNLVNLSFL